MPRVHHEGLTEPSYLGDGVYVDIAVGNYIRLYTNHGEGPEDVIYLDHEGYEALMEYAAKVWPKAK